METMRGHRSLLSCMLSFSREIKLFQTARGDSERQLLPGQNLVGRNLAVGRSQAAGRTLQMVLVWAGRNQAVGRSLVVGRML